MNSECARRHSPRNAPHKTPRKEGRKDHLNTNACLVQQEVCFSLCRGVAGVLGLWGS